MVLPVRMPALLIALVLGRPALTAESPPPSAPYEEGPFEEGESSASILLSAADAHYALRHEGHRGGLADPREITEAIAAYSRASIQDSESAEARWKLARALYFLGTYGGLPEIDRRSAFARGRAAGEEALEILARRRGRRAPLHDLAPAAQAKLLAGEADAAASLFWTAVDWGQWALATNKLEAARQGAASRVRDYCLALIDLAPAFEEGGAYRILGRLHDRAPRIPLFTGWVSRSEGLRYLRLAVDASPQNLVNLQFLAEAVAQAGDRAEARRLEEVVLAATPQPGHLVEELAIQEAAKANLERWRGTGEGGKANGEGRGP